MSISINIVMLCKYCIHVYTCSRKLSWEKTFCQSCIHVYTLAVLSLSFRQIEFSKSMNRSTKELAKLPSEKVCHENIFANDIQMYYSEISKAFPPKNPLYSIIIC